MVKFKFRYQGIGPTVACAALALATIAPTSRLSATEALGDLGVSVRVVDKVPGKGPAGPSMTGVVKIEVLVQAFREAKDVRLQVLRPDGTVWKVKGHPFKTDRPEWTGPGGEPQEPGADGQTVPARGAIRTTIVVPLEGAAIHEIVFVVSGLVDGAEADTSAVVRVPLGVADTQPVDDGTRANFEVTGVK